MILNICLFHENRTCLFFRNLDQRNKNERTKEHTRVKTKLPTIYTGEAEVAKSKNQSMKCVLKRQLASLHRLVPCILCDKMGKSVRNYAKLLVSCSEHSFRHSGQLSRPRLGVLEHSSSCCCSNPNEGTLWLCMLWRLMYWRMLLIYTKQLPVSGLLSPWCLGADVNYK